VCRSSVLDGLSHQEIHRSGHLVLQSWQPDASRNSAVRLPFQLDAGKPRLRPGCTGLLSSRPGCVTGAERPCSTCSLPSSTRGFAVAAGWTTAPTFTKPDPRKVMSTHSRPCFATIVADPEASLYCLVARPAVSPRALDECTTTGVTSKCLDVFHRNGAVRAGTAPR